MALGVKYHDEAIEILISSAHRVTVIKPEQREKFDEDPWTSTVMIYIQGRDRVSRDEILGAAIGLVEKDRDRRASMRVGSIMRTNGWVEKQSRSGRDRGMRHIDTQLR